MFILSYNIFSSFLLHGHHGRRREGVPEGVHQEFHEHYFWPRDTTFRPSFWIEIYWKRFYLPQGHVGLHGGCREGVPGGVDKEVHEPDFWPCDTTFQPSFWIEIDL